MQVTLKKARKIMGELNELANKNSGTDSLVFSAYREYTASAIDDAIAEKRKELNEGLDTFVKVTSWIYEMRSAISDANKKSGIDKIMTDLKQTDILIGKLSAFERAASRSTVDGSDILVRKLDNMRKKLSATGDGGSFYGREDDTISISVYATVEDRVKALKKTKVDLEDKLTALNTSKKIEISDELSSYLTEQGIG